MEPKPWTESRTILANVLIVVLTALGAVSEVPFIAEHPTVVLWIAAAIGAVNIALRLVTGAPIEGTKAADAAMFRPPGA